MPHYLAERLRAEAASDAHLHAARRLYGRRPVPSDIPDPPEPVHRVHARLVAAYPPQAPLDDRGTRMAVSAHDGGHCAGLPAGWEIVADLKAIAQDQHAESDELCRAARA